MRFKSTQGKLIMRCYENDRRHFARANLRNHAETIKPRHLNVEKEKVRNLLLNGGHRLQPIFTLSDYFGFGKFTQKMPDSASGHSVVINNQGTDFAHTQP